MSFDGPPDDPNGRRAGGTGKIAGWAAVLGLFTIASLIFASRVTSNRVAPQTEYFAADQTRQSGSAAVGLQAPDFPFKSVDQKLGGIHSLRDSKGHPVWVNFFATWCPPCKAEMPEIEGRYLAHQADGFLVIGADQQESADLVRKFALAYGITFPLVVDSGYGALAYDVNSLPTSVFIDANGVVRGIYHGQMSATQMDAAVAMIHN